ncbi:MAG: alpha-glucan family phosphorylase [Fimbriimonadaceae bacterium]|nr:MAG: alpha-glucan family phosphorylase [Fimbriimonadaceae bacterium]
MSLSFVPVQPRRFDLPQSIAPLAELALNLRWSWDEPTARLFQAIDPDLWDKKGGPVAALSDKAAVTLLAQDKAFARSAKDRLDELQGYLAAGKRHRVPRVAYFCAEFGLHESFPIYCGGLGILAGDHCKEASDMDYPFVAVGILYRRGFFTQALDWEGRQEHVYPVLDPERLPVERVVHPKTLEPLTIQVEFPGRLISIAAWRAAVGRVPLILLDTDLPENAPEDRVITSQLYMLGREMRLAQEIVLGVGGARMLKALKIEPEVWHMNEGHSALLLVERLRAKSAEEVKATSILTIHTPVPEGNERFDRSAVEEHLKALAPELATQVLERGLDFKRTKGVFDMTALGVRLSKLQNGVSLLHGKTADKTWRKVAGQEVIGLTNGVHIPTWLGPEVRALLESAGARFSGGTALSHLTDGQWSSALELDDAALWEAHNAQKRRLAEFVRIRSFEQLARAGAGPSRLAEALRGFNPDALTIGFARRFAPYKRAHLLFSEPRRLARLMSQVGRPVQIVFAGKAHPGDRIGQKLVEKVYRQAQGRRFAGKVFLLEDYAMDVGRMLVQGVDVWLNNPRRPLEASGTSGMKAAANGVPNLSVLDGWWDEAWAQGSEQNGWAIGGRKTLSDPQAQDQADAESLYEALEQEVVPLYFDRDPNGIPTGWLRVMKQSIASSLWQFSTARMLKEYDERMVGPTP